MGLIWKFSFYMAMTMSLTLAFNAHDIQSFIQLYGDQKYTGQILDNNILKVILLALIALQLFFEKNAVSLRRIIPTVYMLLIIWSAFSIIWSVAPQTSIRRLTELLIVVLSGVLAAKKMNIEESISGIFALFSAVLLVSVIFAALGSNYAIMSGSHSGLWRGFFTHKNAFAPFCALLIILIMFGWDLIVYPRITKHLSLLLAFIGIVASGSSGAMLSLVCALSLGGLSAFSARRKSLWVLVIYAGAAVGVILLLNWVSILETVTTGLGRDVTLSGRTKLWEAALSVLWSNPFGYGYATSGGQLVIEVMRQFTGWTGARSTHNSVIAMSLSVGWPASLLYFSWLVSLVLTFKKSTDRRFTNVLVPLAFFILFEAQIESGYGFEVSPAFFIFTMVLFATYKSRTNNTGATKISEVSSSA